VLKFWTQKHNDDIEIKHLIYSYSSSSYHKKVREGNEDEIIIIWKWKNEN